jgi:hypothetical protein
MNKRQVIVLWILAAALVIAVTLVNSSKTESFRSATQRQRGDALLSDFKPTEVARITVTGAEDKVTLVAQDGRWTVEQRDGYPADISDINRLLRTVAEVKVTQGIEADPEFAPRFGMDPKASEPEAHGIEVVLANDAGSELAHLSFGKDTESAANPNSPFGGGGATGRFVRNHADASGIYVTSERFPSLTADPSEWLADEFLEVEKIRSIAVSAEGKESEILWRLTRSEENGDFKLEGKKEEEELDSTATNPLKNLFSYARFEDVLSEEESTTLWDASKRQQAVIETFEGLTYNVSFAPEKDTDNYLLQVAVTGEIPETRKPAEDETEEQAKAAEEAFKARKTELEAKLDIARRIDGRTFRVTKFTVNPLLKTRSGLIKSAPPANGGAAAGTAPAPGLPRRPQAVTPPIAIPPMPDTGSEE